MANLVEAVLEELNHMSGFIDQSQLDEVCGILIEARERGRRVFVCGAGRSGCVARGFANRLIHLGFSCSFLGEITAPPMQKGDVLFAVSGSGRTSTLVLTAKKAAELGGRILTVTLNAEGDIAKLSEAAILLPGTTRLAERPEFRSIQPVGSAFEQLAWLTCDALVIGLRDALGQTNADLIARHANLE